MKSNKTTLDRRQFLKKAGLGVGIGTLSAASYPFNTSSFSIVDKQLGVALVGLGNYSKNKLAPAFEHTQYCRLAGIVTGTPSKEKEWMDKYGIPQKNVYNYSNFDQIADNPDIDIVYVVLPNAMHADYVLAGLCGADGLAGFHDARALFRVRIPVRLAQLFELAGVGRLRPLAPVGAVRVDEVTARFDPA